MLTSTIPIYAGTKECNTLLMEAGASSWLLEESFKPTQNSISLSQPLRGFTQQLHISGRQWLYEMPTSANGISLQSGLLKLNKRCLYESNTSTNPTQTLQSYFPLIKPRPPGWWHRERTQTPQEAPLILLSNNNNPNYFHWLTQPGLAPLFLQSYFNLPNSTDYTIAVSHRPNISLPSFVTPLLTFVAPETTRHISISCASRQASRFSLQEHDSDIFVSPAQLRWLRDLCRQRLPHAPRPWRRLLISRQDAKTRRCLNEQQLFSVTREYGFQLCSLESLDLVSQLRLFSESDIVISPHGAGLTNIIACHPSSTIIELIPRPGQFFHYFAMADQLSLTHAHILADSYIRDTDDFVVDPFKVIELLNKMYLI